MQKVRVETSYRNKSNVNSEIGRETQKSNYFIVIQKTPVEEPHPPPVTPHVPTLH